MMFPTNATDRGGLAEPGQPGPGQTAERRRRSLVAARAMVPIAGLAALSLVAAWPSAAEPSESQAKSKGTVVTVTANPTRTVTAGSGGDADFTVSATVTVNGKARQGKVVFYDNDDRLGSAALSDGEASLALPADLSFGRHTVKAIFVPSKAGAKKYSDTGLLYWQRQAQAVYTIGGQKATTTDTVVVKAKQKTKFVGKFTKSNGKPVAGTATGELSIRDSDGNWTVAKTYKVKLKKGKAAFWWRNTLKKGTYGRVDWTLSGAWGVLESVEFVSGALPDGDSSDSSSDSSPDPTHTPIPTPTPVRTCRYECVQWGYGFGYGPTMTYGCLQQIFTCS